MPKPKKNKGVVVSEQPGSKPSKAMVPVQQQRGSSFPAPVHNVRINAVQRPLTLQDLPEEEKSKMARIVERLVAVVKENEELVEEKRILGGELDSMIGLKQDAESRASSLNEQTVNHQAGRATATGMLHLYQNKILQLAKELRCANRESSETREKCKSLEEDVKRLDALIASLRESLGRGDEATSAAQLLEKHNEELREEVSVSAAKLSSVLGKLAVSEEAVTSFATRVAALEGAFQTKDAYTKELESKVQALTSSSSGTGTCKDRAVTAAVGSYVGRSGLDMEAEASKRLNNSLLNNIEISEIEQDIQEVRVALSPANSPLRKSVATSPLPRNFAKKLSSMIHDSYNSNKSDDRDTTEVSAEFARSFSVAARKPSLGVTSGHSNGRARSPMFRSRLAPKPPVRSFAQANAKREASKGDEGDVSSTRSSSLLEPTESSSARAAAASKVVMNEDELRWEMKAPMPWDKTGRKAGKDRGEVRESRSMGGDSPRRAQKKEKKVKKAKKEKRRKRATQASFDSLGSSLIEDSGSSANGTPQSTPPRSLRTHTRVTITGKAIKSQPLYVTGANIANPAVPTRRPKTAPVAASVLQNSMDFPVSRSMVQSPPRTTFASRSRARPGGGGGSSRPGYEGEKGGGRASATLNGFVRGSQDKMYDLALFDLVDELDHS
jgi:hypothetical protein